MPWVFSLESDGKSRGRPANLSQNKAADQRNSGLLMRVPVAANHGLAGGRQRRELAVFEVHVESPVAARSIVIVSGGLPAIGGVTVVLLGDGSLPVSLSLHLSERMVTASPMSAAGTV